MDKKKSLRDGPFVRPVSAKRDRREEYAWR
jgi:hypothetical protein